MAKRCVPQLRNGEASVVIPKAFEGQLKRAILLLLKEREMIDAVHLKKVLEKLEKP